MERASDPSGNSLTVDLPSQRVTTSEGQQFAFDVSARRKQTLLRGLDAIGETIEFAADIKRLEAVKSAREPWLAHEPWS